MPTLASAEDAAAAPRASREAAERADDADEQHHEDADGGRHREQPAERHELRDHPRVLQPEQLRPRQHEQPDGSGEHDDGAEEASEHGSSTLGELPAELLSATPGNCPQN